MIMFVNLSGLCKSTIGITGIVGVVTFTVGITLGISLAILVLCIYIRLCYKPSAHSVQVPKQSHPLNQSLEYQDVHFKSASGIPVTQNTAYGRGGRALDQQSRHNVKGIELEENIAYGTN